MIVDGSRNFQLHIRLHVLVELLHSRIQTADNSLQFGEFLDQFRGQIGLGQQRSFVDYTGSNRHPVLFHRLA